MRTTLLLWKKSLRTTAFEKWPTSTFQISLTYQALEKNWTCPWADSSGLDYLQLSCSIFPMSSFIITNNGFYTLEDSECKSSMEQ